MRQIQDTARELSKYCLGRKGITSVRLKDFEEQYKWQLEVEEYAKAMHKTILTLELKDYYDLGKYCIKNQLTMANVMRQAVLFVLDEIRNDTLEFEVINPKNIKKPDEKFRIKITPNIKKKQEKSKQGGLFED
jgi:hypothetical protein